MKPPVAKDLSVKGKVLYVLSLRAGEFFTVSKIRALIEARYGAAPKWRNVAAALQEIDHTTGLLEEETRRTGPFRQPAKFYSIIKINQN